MMYKILTEEFDAAKRGVCMTGWADTLLVRERERERERNEGIEGSMQIEQKAAYK